MLEVLEGGAEGGGFGGVEVIDNGFSEDALGVEVVEEVDEVGGLGPSADGVEAAVGAGLFGKGGVDVALRTEVELGGPTFFVVPAEDLGVEVEVEGFGFKGVEGGAFEDFGEVVFENLRIQT